jgi:ABC-2 type transport system ATP-binding protein
MLTLLNYQKVFNFQTILDIPELKLNSNIYWLKGSNGTGKSTLFRCIAGLIPFSGEVQVEEKSIIKHPQAYRLMVNHAEAEPVFPDFLKGKELIAFYRKAKQGSPEQSQYLMKKLGVDLFADQKCGAYSSGMLKKLSLLLAFTGNPKLILLDEPLITLDRETATALQELIIEYAESGCMFLLTSHQAFDLPSLKPVVLELKSQTLHLTPELC